MRPKREQDTDDEKFFAGVDAALRRAALRARETAARTGTRLVIYKDGKIEKRIIPLAKKSRPA